MGKCIASTVVYTILMLLVPAIQFLIVARDTERSDKPVAVYIVQRAAFCQIGENQLFIQQENWTLGVGAWDSK